MHHTMTTMWTNIQAQVVHHWYRATHPSDERGEGVISAAIAVMIMAFLGAAMWLAFRGIFTNTTQTTDQQISQIGN